MSKDSAGNLPLPGDVESSLRDRIAAVLYERTMSRLAWHRSWADLHPDVQGVWLDDADAVLAALGESTDAQ